MNFPTFSTNKQAFRSSGCGQYFNRTVAHRLLHQVARAACYTYTAEAAKSLQQFGRSLTSYSLPTLQEGLHHRVCDICCVNPYDKGLIRRLLVQYDGLPRRPRWARLTLQEHVEHLFGDIPLFRHPQGVHPPPILLTQTRRGIGLMQDNKTAALVVFTPLVEDCFDTGVDQDVLKKLQTVAGPRGLRIELVGARYSRAWPMAFSPDEIGLQGSFQGWFDPPGWIGIKIQKVYPHLAATKIQKVFLHWYKQHLITQYLHLRKDDPHMTHNQDTLHILSIFHLKCMIDGFQVNLSQLFHE